MYLYFERSNGEWVFVAETTKEEVTKEIYSYVEKLNPNYKIYYVRSWGSDEEGWTYDVGSHIEFFHLVKEKR